MPLALCWVRLQFFGLSLGEKPSYLLLKVIGGLEPDRFYKSLEHSRLLFDGIKGWFKPRNRSSAALSLVSRVSYPLVKSPVSLAIAAARTNR